MKLQPIPSSTRSAPGWFPKFARASARTTGRPGAFGLALGIIAAWAVTGPFFQFSDTWQLVVNTSTSIATFLMVFLIQNTQNRDSEAAQLKLDELIRSNRAAHNALLDIEELSELELDRIKSDFARLAEGARRNLRGYGTHSRPPRVDDLSRHNSPTKQPVDGASRPTNNERNHHE